MVPRRAKGWLLVAGVAVVAAAVGVLAGFVLSDRIAGAVTGVVLAVLGVFGARGRALVGRGAEVRSALPDQVLGAGFSEFGSCGIRYSSACTPLHGTTAARRRGT